MKSAETGVLVFGAGHLGKQILHHLRFHSSMTVLGFIDDSMPKGVEVAPGVYSIGGLETALGAFSGTRKPAAIFAIGYRDMRARGMALDRILASGFELVSFVHPRAIIEPESKIGAGSIVLGGAIIDQGVSIGEGCFVDIGVRVGENTRIGANNYLSSGASLGGAVVVGSGSFFGMDCTVTNGVSVGSHCFVNAKSLVARNLRNDIKLVQVHKTKELPS